MPDMIIDGLRKRLEERITEVQTLLDNTDKRITEVQTILDKADKISRRGLRAAYIGIGISISAVILSIIPLIEMIGK